MSVSAKIQSADLRLQGVPPLLDFWLDNKSRSVVDAPTVAALDHFGSVSPNHSHRKRSDLLIDQEQFSLPPLQLEIRQNGLDDWHNPSGISAPTMQGSIWSATCCKRRAYGRALISCNIDRSSPKRVGKETRNDGRCLNHSNPCPLFSDAQMPIGIENTSEVRVKPAHSINIIRDSVTEVKFYER